MDKNFYGLDRQKVKMKEIDDSNKRTRESEIIFMKMGKVSQQKKNNMKSMLEKGFTHREISSRLHVPRSTVALHSKKLNFKTKSKAGRRSILSERDVSFCVRQISTGNNSTLRELSKELKNRFDITASTDTISRALKKKGLKSAEKKKNPLLSRKNIKARHEFAKNHQDWTLNDWERVIFSDETKINRFNSDGRTWFWARDPTVLNDQSVQKTAKHGGGKIMVWGCMTSEGVGYLSKMDQHLYKNILEDELMKTIEYYELDPSKTIFQHDNDPKYTARSVAWRTRV